MPSDSPFLHEWRTTRAREVGLPDIENRTDLEKNMNRHKGLEWTKVQAKLEANAEKLWSLSEMERTGGEPDVPALPCSYREFHPGLNASNAGSPKVLPETPTRSTQPNRRRAGARALSRCV